VPKRKRSKGFGKLPKPLHEIDFYLLFFVLVILAFGLVMILTAGSVISYNETENSFYYVLRQAKWVLLGSVLAFILTRIPYPILKKFAGIGVVVSLLLLVMVIVSDSAIQANGSPLVETRTDYNPALRNCQDMSCSIFG